MEGIDSFCCQMVSLLDYDMHLKVLMNLSVDSISLVMLFSIKAVQQMR